jgi:hypothetical protein
VVAYVGLLKKDKIEARAGRERQVVGRTPTRTFGGFGQSLNQERAETLPINDRIQPA